MAQQALEGGERLGMDKTLWLHPAGGEAPQHNYVKKINAMITAVAFTETQRGELTIAHDDECFAGLRRGEWCCCDPEITLRVMQHKPGRN